MMKPLSPEQISILKYLRDQIEIKELSAYDNRSNFDEYAEGRWRAFSDVLDTIDELMKQPTQEDDLIHPKFHL